MFRSVSITLSRCCTFQLKETINLSLHQTFDEFSIFIYVIHTCFVDLSVFDKTTCKKQSIIKLFEFYYVKEDKDMVIGFLYKLMFRRIFFYLIEYRLTK